MQLGKINQLSTTHLTDLTVLELRRKIAELQAELFLIKHNSCNVCGKAIPFHIPLYCNRCATIDEPKSGGW